MRSTRLGVSLLGFPGGTFADQRQRAIDRGFNEGMPAQFNVIGLSAEINFTYF